jgi:hypothetical protein
MLDRSGSGSDVDVVLACVIRKVRRSSGRGYWYAGRHASEN